jgi:hypothetical protein
MMVVSANADLYSPFPHSLSVDEGPQSTSSEEGSGLHSPVLGPPFPSPNGDSSRLRKSNQFSSSVSSSYLPLKKSASVRIATLFIAPLASLPPQNSASIPSFTFSRLSFSPQQKHQILTLDTTPTIVRNSLFLLAITLAWISLPIRHLCRDFLLPLPIAS